MFRNIRNLMLVSMLSLLDDKQALFGIGCCIMGIVGLIISGVMTYFLLPLLEQLLMYLIVAVVVIIILAIVVKRYLLGGK